jgi:hypothetical protein
MLSSAVDGAEIHTERGIVCIHAHIYTDRVADSQSLQHEVRQILSAIRRDLVLDGFATPMKYESAAPRTGAEMIAVERRQQVEREGWTQHHDDSHRNGELAVSAARYAIQHTKRSALKSLLAKNWRWGSCWWKPKDPIRDLVRAGALIAAEIDRLQRVEARAKEPQR